MALSFGPLYKDFKKDLEKNQQTQQVMRQEQAAGVRPVYKAPVAPKQSIWDKTRDIFDANSPMDKAKRRQAGEPIDYAQQQKEVYGNNRPATNLAGALYGGTARFWNTAEAARDELVDTVRMATASKDMKPAYAKMLAEDQEKRFAQDGGLGGQGTWFKSAEDYRKTASNPLSLLKRAGLSVAETVPELASFGLAGKVNKLSQVGLKQFVKTGAQKAAVRGFEGMAGDIAGQQFQRDKWSPEQTLMSGAVAVALPIAAGGVTKGGKMAVKAVSEYEPKMRAGFVKIPGLGDETPQVGKTDPLYIRKIREPIEKELKDAQAEMDKYGTGYINDIDLAAKQAKAKARLDKAKEADWQNSESKIRARNENAEKAFRAARDDAARIDNLHKLWEKSEPWYKARKEITDNYINKFKTADDFIADFNTNDGIIPKDIKIQALGKLKNVTDRNMIVEDLRKFYNESKSTPVAQVGKPKPDNPTQPLPTKSLQDWEANYADRYGELQGRYDTLAEQYKTAKKADKPLIKRQMENLNAETKAIEEEFIGKYKGTVDENVDQNYTDPPKPKVGFSRAGESMDMSRYKPTGQTPEQARIADMAKRTGISESTLIREASRRGGIDKIEGVASSLTDDVIARSKDAVFTVKLKDTVPVVKQSQKPEVTAKLPVREDVPYDVDPATGGYRTAADMIDNAPDVKKVSPVQAQEITGAVVNRIDEGMDAVDNILKGKGSSLEEMFRAIQTAMRNGDAFPEQYRAEYNMVKATLDKLRDASGKKMGDIGDGYLPQFRPDGGPQVQVGKSLVELIDVEDFGFSKQRKNVIPLEELDYTKEGIKKYATQAMSYKYRDALDIEAIQKRAMETDGVKLTDKEALAVRDKEVEIAKDVQEAASKPGAILKADILDKTDELAGLKKKPRIEISDGVSFAKRELLDTDTLTRDIQLRTPEGKTKNMFEVFGFKRYRDAEGNAKQILYKALENGDYDSIKAHIASTNLPEATQKHLLQRLGDDLRAVQAKAAELDVPEAKVAEATKELYEAVLTKFERGIAREELTRAMETYKISNKGLRKVVNFHAQRMLTHDGYTRNLAEKATNLVTGLYYRGALGYNFSSALLNLFELQRITSEVGFKQGATAIKKALADWDITKRYGLHESSYENLLELRKEGINVKKSKLSTVENYSGLMKMFEWTERIKDATLLHALEAKYANAGLSEQARVTRILADFNKLAIKGGQFGSVGLYKSKTGRILFQFMQYPIKDLTITASKVGKAFNGDTEASKYLARLMVQRTILYMVMNAAIGTSAEVAFGIFNPVRQARIDEEAGLDEKAVSYFPGGPAISMLKDTYIAMQQAQREAERNDEQFDPADVLNKQVKRDLTLLVPGGNQIINKTLGFQADMDRGYNQSSYKNSKGEEVNRARFATPDNPIDIAKGYIFGPYATKDANEYFGKKLGSDLPVVGDKLAGEKYSPVSKRQQERIEAGGNARELIEEERVNQRAKKEFKKTNPNLWATYEEITKTTYNESTKKRESDVITPEKWKKIHSDDSLKLFGYIKQMAEARNRQYGDTLDPIYKLTDPKQIKAVLAIRSAYTGDDEESKDILRARNPWYKKFEKDYIEYIKSFDKNTIEQDSEFGSSQRKADYIELNKQNPSIPEVSKQKYPIISKYLNMEEGSEARKQFYKNNADALSAAFEQQKKDKFEWTNQMRSLEGASPLAWEAFQNVTFGYTDDEEKVAKSLYFKGKSGSSKGGSRKVSMKAPETYGTELRAGGKVQKQTVKKIAAPSAKVKKVAIAKPKVSMKKSKV